jgi:hypothetical protein
LDVPEEMGMRTVEPNLRLIEVMRRAQCSNKGLAARVRQVGAERGEALKTDHVTVKHWRDGAIPRGRTPEYIAEALSRKAGYPVSLEDIGMAGAPRLARADTSLEYADSVEKAELSLADLIRHDLASDATAHAEIVPPAWSAPIIPWLLTRPEPVAARTAVAPHVGRAEVEAIRTTTSAFMRMDFQYGGGHARVALAQYFASEVLPLLHGNYSDTTGVALFSAAADVAQLLGWTAYDLALHGLAQRYFIQAVRLAQAAGDRAMGARVLANMSHQATYLGRFTDAVQLARAAQEGARARASATVIANLLAMEARALAAAGDGRACDHVLGEAETVFGRRNVADDPPWISYFTESELAGEAAHCFRDLRRPALAQEFVPSALRIRDEGCARSLAFIGLVHAASWLHKPATDVDRAIAVATEAIDSAKALKSDRYRRYVRDFCTDLRPYGAVPGVQEFLRNVRRSCPTAA